MPQMFPTNATTEVEEEVEAIEIDLDAEVTAESPDADLYALIPQPPAGIYLLQVSLQDRGEQDNPYPSQTKKDKKPFVGAILELSIVKEGDEFHDFKLMDNINSLVQGRRQTSALHYFMHCIGETLPTTISIRDLLAKVKGVFENGPVMVQAEIEWKASRKVGSGKFDWEEVAKTMKEFPKNKDGDGYDQVYIWKDPKNPKHQVECRAQAYVRKYLPQS